MQTFENEELEDIKGLNKLNLTFDRNENNKYLAVYGETMFKLFDIEKEGKQKKHHVYQLDQIDKDLKKIWDIQIESAKEQGKKSN